MAHLDLTIPIRWSDLDGYQHVNNTAYLRLLEEARIQALWEPTERERSLGVARHPIALGDCAPGGTLHTFVASHRIEYLRQMEYLREGVNVRLWISRIGTASVDVDYVMSARDNHERPYAKARTVVVIVDANTAQPVRIPGHMRDAFEQIMDPPVSFRQ